MSADAGMPGSASPAAGSEGGPRSPGTATPPGGSSTPAPMILRIKRKRGTEAPDALFVQQQLSKLVSPDIDDAQAKSKRRSSIRLPASPSTDALPVLGQDASPRRSPTTSRGSTQGFFRLAETVTVASVSTGRSAEVELRRRVAKLQLQRRQQQEQASAAEAANIKAAQGSAAEPATASLKGKAPERPAQVTGRVATAAKHSSSPLKKTSSAVSLTKLRDEKHRAGRVRKPGIVPGAASAAYARARQAGQPLRPPRKAQSRIIDIVVDAPAAPKVPQAARKAKAPQPKMDDVDSLGDVFRSMLVDHLKAKNAPLPDDLAAEEAEKAAAAAARMDEIEEDGSDDEDYVYDIYYHDVPSMPSRAAADGPAAVGLRPSQIVGAALGQEEYADEEDEMERDERMSTPADGSALASSEGSLADLRPYLGIAGVKTIASLNVSNFSQADLDDLFLPPGQSEYDLIDDVELVDDDMLGKKPSERPGASDDSWDEGEDEDSNDEGFYRNDYPEQELSDDDDVGLGQGYGDDSEEEDSDWY